MKIVTLLRHAKSTWDDPVARDFDRPLNPRGRRAARTIGGEMKAQGLAFDRVIASPARRVVETLEEVAAVFGPIEPAYDEALYLASTETLIEMLRKLDDGVERVLVVGHNPGMELLVLRLAKAGGRLREQVEIKYPTGTLAEIALPADSWSRLREGSGTLARFVRPRDLDPELGPDEDSA